MYAAKLEMHFSKDQILETYLNTIYYGHGVYGIQKAAAFFFGKELDDCTLGEMAMLAGIPNGPSLFSPFISMDNARSRQAVVLQAMVDNEKLSQREADSAKAQPVLLAGDAVELFRAEQGLTIASPMTRLQNGTGICLAAAQAQWQAPAELMPEYLQLVKAEKDLQEKQRAK